jgi:ribokinase
VTLGELGAFVLGSGSEFHVDAFPVQPVATVGAGDSFNGALAAALVEGRGLQDAVRFASAAAMILMRPGS